jgi:hypothetical protein
MGTVCVVLGEPKHTQAGLSLFFFSRFFFFSFFSLLFRYTTTHTHTHTHTLLPYSFPSFSSHSIFYMCWLAGCLVYPTAAQRQANEKRRTVMDARP